MRLILCSLDNDKARSQMQDRDANRKLTEECARRGKVPNQLEILRPRSARQNNARRAPKLDRRGCRERPFGSGRAGQSRREVPVRFVGRLPGPGELFFRRSCQLCSARR